jgi:hypothetical protein
MIATGPRASAVFRYPSGMVALVAPAVIGTCLVLVVACAELLGWTLLSVVPANIAEAAAMGNAADTLWFLEEGHDPRRIEDVRPEIISPEITRLTALEAAVWSRQSELVALLDRRGAIAADARRELACLAGDLSAEDIVAYFPEDIAAGCEPGAASQRVVARTAGAIVR